MNSRTRVFSETEIKQLSASFERQFHAPASRSETEMYGDFQNYLHGRIDNIDWIKPGLYWFEQRCFDECGEGFDVWVVGADKCVAMLDGDVVNDIFYPPVDLAEIEIPFTSGAAPRCGESRGSLVRETC